MKLEQGKKSWYCEISWPILLLSKQADAIVLCRVGR